MAKFIVEVTKAFSVEAESEDEAFRRFSDEPDPQTVEQWHKEAGYWSEVTGVYPADGVIPC